MKYWIPLLHVVGEHIKFSGQAIPLPLDKKIIGSIVKEKISEGFQNPKLTDELGLFCKIGPQRYLLGVNKIFNTPSLPLGQSTTKNKFGTDVESKISVKMPNLVEELNAKVLSKGKTEEENFHNLKDYLDQKMHGKTQLKHQGVKIKLSGRINGVNMAKSVETRWGQIKPQSYNHLEYKLKHVRTPWGIFGLRVYLS